MHLLDWHISDRQNAYYKPALDLLCSEDVVQVDIGTSRCRTRTGDDQNSSNIFGVTWKLWQANVNLLLCRDLVNRAAFSRLSWTNSATSAGLQMSCVS